MTVSALQKHRPVQSHGRILGDAQACPTFRSKAGLEMRQHCHHCRVLSLSVATSTQPSPSIPLCLQIKDSWGLKKNKLELKYSTFSKTSILEEEAKFGRFYKFKAAMDSKTVRHPEFNAADRLADTST
jgi:hypothetical protein